MNFFTGCRDLNEAKKLYRKLSMEHHPDHGGDEEVFKQIANEFELFCKSYMGQAFDETGRAYSAEDVFQHSEVLRKACELNCRIEVVGTWIWAFESFAVKDDLKAMGFRFSGKKKAWYYSGESKSRRYRGSVPMDEIRKKYGSRVVRDRQYAKAIA